MAVNYEDPKELEKIAKAVEQALDEGVAKELLYAIQGKTSQPLITSIQQTNKTTKTK